MYVYKFLVTTNVDDLGCFDTYEAAREHALAITSPGNACDCVIWRTAYHTEFDSYGDGQVVAVIRDNGEHLGVQEIVMMRVPLNV